MTKSYVCPWCGLSHTVSSTSAFFKEAEITGVCPVCQAGFFLLSHNGMVEVRRWVLDGNAWEDDGDEPLWSIPWADTREKRDEMLLKAAKKARKAGWFSGDDELVGQGNAIEEATKVI